MGDVFTLSSGCDPLHLCDLFPFLNRECRLVDYHLLAFRLRRYRRNRGLYSEDH